MKIPLVKLSDFCDLQNGFAFKSDDYVESSNTLVCRMSNIRPDATFNILYNPKYLPNSYVEKYKDFLLNNGDIIIAMTDMANDPKILGVPTIVETQNFNLLLNQRVGKLCKIDSNKVFVPYLQKVLSRQELKSYFKKFAGGGLQLNIGKGDLLNIKIPLPPLDDQIRIADILTRAENLIAKRKESIKALDELLKSTFLEMFGDPVRNEKGWEVKLLNKITKVGTGGTPSRKNESLYYNGKIRWAKTTEVNGSYINDTSETITEIAIKESNCKIYPIHTILLAMYGQGKTRGNVGYLKIEAATNQACAAITPSDNINQIFLFELLKNSYLNLRSLARGGNQENLNLDIVGNYPTIFPPLILQNQFATIVEKVESLKAKYQQNLDELEKLYGSLSQQAFNGEMF